MKTFETIEISEISKGSKKISTSLGYGQDSILSVFLNEEPISDYTFDENNNIILNEPTDNISEVNVYKKIDTLNSTSIIFPGKANKSNSLFNRYSDTNNLLINNKYKLHVLIDDVSIDSVFNSKLSPMVIQTSLIFKEIGEFIEGYTDQDVSERIYNYSKELIDLIDELANQEDPVTNITYTVDKDGNYTFSNKTVAKNYVLAKTAIDLIYSRYFGISLRYGSIKKQIGDIDVERTTKLPYVDTLLGRYQKMLEDAESIIKGKTIAVSAVRAGTNTYDDWARKTTF